MNSSMAGKATAPQSARYPVRVITGSGRSGTTWIQDVLAEANNLRAVFEPLKAVSRRVPKFENAYLTRENQVPELQEFLADVFESRYRSIWTEHRILPVRLCPNRRNIHSLASLKGFVRRWESLCRKTWHHRKLDQDKPVLVKFIRANLMMDWLVAHFDVKSAFILRHPGAVVESQIRLGGGSWDPAKRLSVLFQQTEYVARYEGVFGAYIGRSLSPAESNTLIWCLENYLPLQQAKEGLFKVVCYESLVDQPSTAWPILLEALSLENFPASEVLTAPSQQASEAWKVHGNQATLNAWTTRLTETEKSEVQRVLDDIGISVYSMEEPMPNLEALVGKA